MICPNCGHEIPEGRLLCEKCGAEINIVPDFDIEIENSINETLSNIVDEITPSKDKENESLEKKPKSKKTKEEILEDEFFEENKVPIRKSKRHNFLAYILLGVVIIIASAILSFLFIYKNLSSSYQFRQAEELYINGDYDKALEFIDKAITLDENKNEYLLKKVDILIKMSQDDEAISLLLSSIDKSKIDNKDDTVFFDRLLEIYISTEEYYAASQILNECDNEVIIDKYLEYTANSPVFDIPTGNYENSVKLRLNVDNLGAVYYSLDGQDPTSKHGVLYKGPIDLLAGEYDIKAVFINQYGVSSSIVSSYYMIDVTKPDEPIVDVDSGNFDKPFTLSVSSNDELKIYYTDDGSEPDLNLNSTKLYKGPIKVDFGNYNYNFVCVNDDNVMSEMVKRSYHVELKTKVTPTMAEYQLLQYMTQLGLNKSEQGTYSYKFDSIVEILDYGYYYKLDEYLTTSDGSTIATGNLYAVDAYKNVPYRLVINADGSFGIMNIG